MHAPPAPSDKRISETDHARTYSSQNAFLVMEELKHNRELPQQPHVNRRRDWGQGSGHCPAVVRVKEKFRTDRYRSAGFSNTYASFILFHVDSVLNPCHTCAQIDIIL
ncbi:hypothetical protein AVEN_53464-1 [Araneus ventricosus]|uniref:Uncharacterized protein n=1 Tax=Araneus ventricosus TaxID=182803 RepID=A0A4Y2ABV7_ARAVE|nr:hypothetical protein AVEN_53464-1 [Araneus ventricosus]